MHDPVAAVFAWDAETLGVKMPARILPTTFAICPRASILSQILARLTHALQIYFPNSLLAFALIRAAWAGESLPACSSLVANSSALIW